MQTTMPKKKDAPKSRAQILIEQYTLAKMNYVRARAAADLALEKVLDLENKLYLQAFTGEEAQV